MQTTTIAIDNGSTGSVSVFAGPKTVFTSTPTKDELRYTKKGGVIQRIDYQELQHLLAPFLTSPCRAYIERPFTGGMMMINTMLLSARAYEATVITLETLGIGYETVDSKGWQAAMIPGVKGSAALKQASKLRGMQLFPEHAVAIKAHGDADSLLMGRFYSERLQHNTTN